VRGLNRLSARVLILTGKVIKQELNTFLSLNRLSARVLILTRYVALMIYALPVMVLIAFRLGF